MALRPGNQQLAKFTRPGQAFSQLAVPGSWIWLLLPVVLTFMQVATSTQYPLDYWHQVTTGEAIWRTASMVQQEPFAFTIAGQPIVNHNWLAQLFFFGVHSLGGYAASQFVVAVLYAGAFLLLERLLWRRAHEVRVVAVLTLGVLGLTAANVTVRPQVFSVLLFVAELYVLWCWPRKAPRLAAVVAIEILWTNLHGAFPLGVVLPGIFLVGEVWNALARRDSLFSRRVGHELLCTLAAAAAMFVNPFPASTWAYFSGVVSRAPARGIEEWLPTSWASFTGQSYVISLALALAWLAQNARRLSHRETCLLAAFCILGAHSVRMVAWWGIVLSVVLAQSLGRFVRSRSATSPAEDRSLVNTMAVAALLALAAFSTPWTRSMNPLLPPGKRSPVPLAGPTAAASELANNPPHRIFAPMEWGAELTWKLAPQSQVFLDCRLDFFPDEVWDDYVAIGQAQGDWQQRLNRWGVDTVVWNKELSLALPQALEEAAGWQKVYEDPAAVVYRRRAEPSQLSSLDNAKSTSPLQ